MKKNIKKYKKIIKKISKYIINNILAGTHFFKVKRWLLIISGFKIGYETKIVGPIDFGGVIDVEIGNFCWIGKNLKLDGNGTVIIGNNIDIAPQVTINTGGHLIGKADRRAGMGVVNKIVVEDGVWIGTQCTIINNTTIKKGSVIAAGCVVISDTIENCLYAGVPGIKKKELQ